MSLLKELTNLDESSERQRKMAKKMANTRLKTLTANFEQFLMSFNEGSALETLLKDAGADMSYFKDGIKQVEQLEDTLAELERSIDDGEED